MLDYLKNRKIYTNTDRVPFYKIIKNYLPKNKKAKILDLGCGNGTLYEYLDLHQYENVYLLDGEKKTIEYLQRKTYGKPIHWIASENLPFSNDSVSLLHCSHMIEHLTIADLNNLIGEGRKCHEGNTTR